MKHLGLGRFFGRVASACSSERVHLSHTAHPPSERLPSHCHKSAYLSFVSAGSYVESVGSRQFACVPFMLRFHPAGEEHADQFGPVGAQCLNIELAGDWTDALESAGLAHQGPIAIDTAAWPALRLSAEVAYDIAPPPLPSDGVTAVSAPNCVRKSLTTSPARGTSRGGTIQRCTGSGRQQIWLARTLGSRIYYRSDCTGSRLLACC